MPNAKCIFALAFCIFNPFVHGSLWDEVEDHINHFKWTMNKELKYLNEFGYIEPNINISNMNVGKMMSSALKTFQEFAGIPETGIFDEETQRMMESPRCGVKDIGVPKSLLRRKRYTLQGSKWTNKILTYDITIYPPPSKLNREDVDREVKRSFTTWSDVTNLQFVRATHDPIIKVLFARGAHGCGDPFDGPGNTLAHAFFPLYGGDVHIDLDENWTVSGKEGVNLYQTVVHEIGHSLGLAHSRNSAAVMAPIYRGYIPNRQLHEDDIKGIQALYGIKDASKPSSSNQLCGTKKFDTIITTSPGMSFVFKGSSVYKINEVGLVSGYPKRISSEFPGLPDNIDASVSLENGTSYILKGNKYWMMTLGSVEGGYPRNFQDLLPGIPKYLDAALLWSDNNLYFFKGNKFWTVNPRYPNPNPYPEYISSKWKGIPSNIDAALKYSNGHTYFFKGDQYWRFNDRRGEVDAIDKNVFPRKTEVWWFGCKHKTDFIRG